jgi:hypothetical protein
VRIELGKGRTAQLGPDQVKLREVGVRCLNVLPAVALRPTTLTHPPRPCFEPAHAIVDGARRHAPLAFSGNEVVRHCFGELPDGFDAVILTESLKDPKHDLVSRGGAARLLGTLFGEELGDRSPMLGPAGVDGLFAQQLVVVFHLVKSPAFWLRHCALSWSVKALTEADEPRDWGLRKLTKVEVAG